MGKSKLIFIFSLGYPQPPQRRLRGDAGGQEEGLTPTPRYGHINESILDDPILQAHTSGGPI